MDTVILAEGLTRRFGDLAAVDCVDFAVERGEVFGFLGPNGAGKTTTVRMLTGIIEPTEGRAVVRGHDVARDSVRARRRVGVVPEEANVYLDLSVWQNVMLMAQLHGVRRRERERCGAELLERFGLGERRRQKARALSKGLRQRLMLCTALVAEPALLFLDEPTSGLDVASTRLIRQIVRELNDDGLTVFLTTHNMEEAEEICDRVAIIHRGRIAAVDTPDELRNVIKARRSVQVRFKPDAPGPAALAGLPGVTECTRPGESVVLYTESPGAVAAAVVRLAEREGLQIEEISTRRPSLEDVYLYYTAGEGESDGRAG